MVLRSSAFDALDLPITLVQGTIGLVELHVPWKSMRSSHVVLNIKDVTAIVGPNLTRPDIDHKLQKQRDARRSRLESDLKARRIFLTSKPGEQASWLAKMITAIIHNMEVRIEGVRIRFEDANSVPSCAMAFTISLNGLFLETTDENFNPIPFFSNMGKMYKLARLDSLMLHWDSNAQRASETSAWKERVSLSSTNDRDLVIHPIAFTVKLMLAAAVAPNAQGSATPGSQPEREPKISAAGETKSIRLSLRPAVLRDATILAGAFAAHRARTERFERRPMVPSYRGYYKVWWRYAIQEAARVASTRRFRFDDMVVSARNAKEYFSLFRRQLAVLPLPPLTEAEAARLHQIEDNSSDEFVYALRARVQLAVEAQARELLDQVLASQSASTGFLQRLCSGIAWASTGAASAQDVRIGGMQVTLTPAQAQAIDSLFSEPFGDEREEQSERCDGDVLHHIRIQLAEMAIGLEEPACSELTSKNIAFLVLAKADVSFSHRARGYCASASLQHASISSWFGGDQPDIFHMKDCTSGALAAATQDGVVPIFTTVVEYLPVDGQCDYKVRGAVQPVVLVLRPEWICAFSSWCGAAECATRSRFHGISQPMMPDPRENRTLARSTVERLWMTRAAIDLQYTIESATLRLVSMQMFESESSSNHAVTVPGDIQNFVELQLGRFSATSISLADISKSDTDGQYDRFQIEVTGIEVRISNVKHDNYRLSVHNKSVLYAAEPCRILGPLSLCTEVSTAIVRTSPLVPLIIIRCQMHCPAIVVHDELLCFILKVSKIFITAWDPGSRVGTINGQGIHICKSEAIEKLEKHGVVGHGMGQYKTSFFNMLNAAVSRNITISGQGQDRKLACSNWRLIDFEFQLLDTFAIKLMECKRCSVLFEIRAEDFNVNLVLQKLSLHVGLRLAILDIEDCLWKDHPNSTKFGDSGFLLKTKRFFSESQNTCQDFVNVKACIMDQRCQDWQNFSCDMKLEVEMGSLEMCLYQQSVFACCGWFERVFNPRSGEDIAMQKTMSNPARPSCSVQAHKLSSKRHTYRAQGSFPSVHLRLFQNVGESLCEIAQAEVIDIRFSLVIAESVSANLSITDLKIIDPNHSKPTGHQTIFSSLDKNFHLVGMAFTFTRANYMRKVFVRVKGFQFDCYFLFVDNLARYFKDCEQMLSPNKQPCDTSRHDLDAQHYLLVECEVERFDVFFPLDHTQRPIETGVLIHFSECCFQKHGSKLFCSLQCNLNAIGYDGTVSTIFKTNSSLSCQESAMLSGIGCARHKHTCQVKLKSTLLCLTAEGLITLAETWCNTLSYGSVLVKTISGTERGTTPGFQLSENTAQTVSVARDLCLEVEIDILEARLLKRLSSTVSSDELCIITKNIKGEAQLLSDGMKDAQVTVGELAIDFSTAKSHCFKTVLDSRCTDRAGRMLRAYALHLFHLCDRDNSGTLEVTELLDIMQKLGHPVSREQARNIMSKADVDGSGVLDGEEFMQFFGQQLGSQNLEENIETNIEMKSVCTCHARQMVDGSQQVEIDIGRLDFMITKESLEILLFFVDSWKGYRGTCIHADGDKSETKRHQLGILRNFLLPVEDMKTELVNLSKMLPFSRMSRSIQIELQGLECGIILESSSFASDTIFIKSGVLHYEAVHTKDSMSSKAYFFSKNVEVALSSPHLHPKTRWESILNPSEVAVIQVPSRDNKQHLDGEIRVNSLTINMKISQIIFISRLLEQYTPLLRAQQPTKSSRASTPSYGHPCEIISCQNHIHDYPTETILKKTWTMNTMDMDILLIDDVEMKSLAFAKISFCVSNLSKTVSLCSENYATFIFNLGMSCDIINRERLEWEPLLEPWSLKLEALAKLDSSTQLLSCDAASVMKLSFAPDHIQTLLSIIRKCTDVAAKPPSRPDVVASDKHVKPVDSDCSTEPSFHLSNCTHYTLLVEIFFNGKSSLKDLLPGGSRIPITVPDESDIAMRIRPEISACDQLEWSPLMPILLRQSCVSKGNIAHCFSTVEEETVSRSLLSCFAIPHVLHFEVRFHVNSASIHTPWKVTNYLPYNMRLTLWAKASHFTYHVRQATATRVQAAATKTLPFSLELASSILLELDNCDFHMSREADLNVQHEPPGRFDLQLRDSSGKTVMIHATITYSAGAELNLIIYPQMVLVNWTGLPLKWGRCRINLENKKVPGCLRLFQKEDHQNCGTNMKEIMEAAGVETQITPEMFASPDCPCFFTQESQPFERTSSNAEILPWNKAFPSVLIFDCPAGPEWDPCVSVDGSSKWERISDDFETSDSGLQDSAILQRVSLISLASSISKGAYGYAEYALGVDLGRGVDPFHRTIVSQVCQEEFSSIDQDVTLILRDRTMMSSLGTFLPTQNPNLVFRQISNLSEPITHWSCPFNPLKAQEAALLLWPEGESGDEHQSIQLRCDVSMWSASIFVHILPHNLMTALYSVRNDTTSDVKIWQRCSIHQELRGFTIRSGQHRAIAWHENHLENYAIVCVKVASDNACMVTVNLDDIGSKGRFGVHGHLEYEVQMDGNTHLLLVQCPQQASPGPADQSFATCMNISDNHDQKLLFYMEGISVSLVNKERQELLHGFLGALSFDCIVKADKLCSKLKILRMQISNQTDLGHAVVMASPCDRNGFLSRENYFLKINLIRDLNVKSLVYWKSVAIQVGDINASIEELWMNELKAFENEAFDNGETGSTLSPVPAAVVFTGHTFSQYKLLQTLEFLSLPKAKSIYGAQFQKLYLSQVRINVSFFGFCFIRYRPEEFRSGLLATLYKFLHSAGEKAILPDIERGSIELSRVNLSNKRIRLGESVVKIITAHYAKSVMIGALKILASPGMWASFLESIGDSAADCERRQMQLAEDRAKLSSVSCFRDSWGVGINAMQKHVYEGFSGAISKPWQGMQSKGFSGLVQVCGAVQMASRAYQGISAHNAEVKTGNNSIKRFQAPRASFFDKVLQVYDEDESRVYGLLRKTASANGFAFYSSLPVLLVNPEDPICSRLLLLRISQIREVCLRPCGIRNRSNYHEKHVKMIDNGLDKGQFADVLINIDKLVCVPAQTALVDILDDNVPDIDAHKVQGLFVTNGQSWEFGFESFKLKDGRISGRGMDGSKEFVICGTVSDSGVLTFDKTYLNGEPSVIYTGTFTSQENISTIEGTFHECCNSSPATQFVLYLPKRQFRQMKITLKVCRASELVARILKFGKRRQANLGCSLQRDYCSDCNDCPELLRRCLDLWVEGKALQAFRYMSKIEQVDPAFFAEASVSLAPLQQTIKEIELLRTELDSVKDWNCVRKGQCGQATVECRHKAGSDAYTLRVDCEVSASLEHLLITLHEVDEYPSWQPCIGASRLLAMSSRFHRVLWMEMWSPAAPLLHRRDVCLDAHVIDGLDEDSQVLILLYDHMNGDRGIASPPLHTNTARLSLEYGGIILQPLSRDRTRFRILGKFQGHIGMIPSWLVEWLAATMCQTGVQQLEAAAQNITRQPRTEAGGRAKLHQDVYCWIAERCRIDES